MSHSLIGRVLHNMLSLRINGFVNFVKYALSLGYADF